MQELRILLWLMYQNRNVMFIYNQRGGEHFTKTIVTESYKEGYLRVSDARQYIVGCLS
jgi:hypothetical protein